jgi:hypothetical protein
MLDAVLLESHRGFVVEANLCLSPAGPALQRGGPAQNCGPDLVVVLAESTNDDNGRDPAQVLCSCVAIDGGGGFLATSSSFLAATSRSTAATLRA